MHTTTAAASMNQYDDSMYLVTRHPTPRTTPAPAQRCCVASSSGTESTVFSADIEPVGRVLLETSGDFVIQIFRSDQV